MSIAAGTHLGSYEILSPIGRGGMGAVWKARDTRLGRVVAIKQILGERDERFDQEARAIAALNHPHICTLYDVGPDYLVMEYVEGSPLRGPLPAGQALSLALQIAEALAEAHAHSILHCDLKPANILVTPRGSIKLLDFGLARLAKSMDSDVTLTVEGTISGTPAYMSPEQARGLPLDPRSDVFSFGAVLYEMLSGRPAFTGNSTAEVLSSVLRDEPAPLDAAPELGRVVIRCLRKAAAERPASMGDVISALEAVKSGVDKLQAQPSIAVLPFANMSGDKENEYFSDGLSEEIINALTKMPGLQVTARTSSFSFRGKDIEIREIARKLDVEYILEGSVRKAGNRIRVTAQLIKAANQFHLWSERYDRELTDIFAIQDEMSAAIAGQLKLSLLPASRRRVPKLAAYEAYLESRHHWQKMNPEGFAKSLECAERAIAIDPDYAEAYVSRAAYYISVAWYGGADPRELMPQARASVLKALSLDETQAEAHAALGVLKAVFEYDWPAAEEHFRRALSLDQNLYVMLPYANWYLRPLGRLEEALAVFEALRRRDPVSGAARSELANALLSLGRYEEAAEVAGQTLDVEANHDLALFTLVSARVKQGRYEEAVAAAERDVQLSGRWAVPLTYLGYAYAAAGRLDDARIVRDEMHELAEQGYVNATAFANIYCALGEIDTAVDWVDRAIDQREPIVTLLKTWPLFDGLRGHPRYPGLLSKMNL